VRRGNVCFQQGPTVAIYLVMEVHNVGGLHARAVDARRHLDGVRKLPIERCEQSAFCMVQGGPPTVRTLSLATKDRVPDTYCPRFTARGSENSRRHWDRHGRDGPVRLDGTTSGAGGGAYLVPVRRRALRRGRQHHVLRRAHEREVEPARDAWRGMVGHRGP
jgi:hypothetical protein